MLASSPRELPPPVPQSFAVKTFGCQMNVYDSQRIEELLTADGMRPAGAGEAPDVVVLNTCHIREKAAEKVYSDIGRLRNRAGGRPRIVVAGCVAQAEGAEIFRRAAAVDVVVGPNAYHRLPALLASATRAIDLDMPTESKFDALPPRPRRVPPSAFLTVQEGCDKFCTFCVVPYTRGSEVSRPAAALRDEAAALIAAGARELTLLGQNVNAYADGTTGFADLLRQLATLPGLVRLRYMTSHPRDMTDALIAAHAELPQLMPFLHLPVQAGADTLLRRMNRAHTVDSYLAVIDRLRAGRPDIALSSDFIVGFPGETDAEFAGTLALVGRVGYAQAYSFKYSPRPGTPAATMPNQIPEPVKDERLAALQTIIARGALAFNRATEGRRCDVLLDRPGRRPGQLIGKSPWLQSVFVEAPGAAIGDFVTVTLGNAQPNSVEGFVDQRLAA